MTPHPNDHTHTPKDFHAKAFQTSHTIHDASPEIAELIRRLPAPQLSPSMAAERELCDATCRFLESLDNVAQANRLGQYRTRKDAAR